MATMDAGNPLVRLPFIHKADIFSVEKAYDADVFTDEIARTNMRTNWIDTVPVTDVRPEKQSFNFERDGFEIFDHQTSMASPDWDDQRIVEDVYCQEIGEAMRKRLGAVKVQIFEAQVRKRHSSFPYGKFDPSVSFQPAMRPHIDSTQQHAIDKIKLLNPSTADQLLAKPWVYFNTWKPLIGPVRDWPLAICDPDSVNDPEDLLEVDMVLRGQSAENIQLHYSQTQRWMYIDNQMPNEVLLFRQADSQGRTGVPHASFELALPAGEIPEPRQSVEVRMFAYFDA